MNYGKLTAGTTKTAIDTAKPSEKGEIITYLSRMGDVLHNVAEGCKLIFALGAVHAVIDSDKPDAMLGKKLVRVKPHLQIVAAQPGHILDHHGTDVPVLDGLDHFGKAGAIES